MLEEAHDYLPGYLFLYSDTALTSFPWMDGMIRWLGREELKGNDYEFAAMLYRRNGVIGTAKVAEIGDRVKLADPAWENMDGKIIKLDRHRKRCCIAFLFEKAERTVWVGYDMVAPQESEITG